MVAPHYKKDDLLHCWTSSSDISGYHADIHEGHGTIGAGQGRSMLCVNRPLVFTKKKKSIFTRYLQHNRMSRVKTKL